MLNHPARLCSAEALIAERRSRCERRLDRLGDYLGDADDQPSEQPRQPDTNQEEQ